jgi:putative ABC transport system permease protein
MRSARIGRASPRRGSGGMAARRAVVRWAWRLFRRDWRQQVLILGLITFSVAAAIFSAAVAYNAAPASGRADFGNANYRLKFDGSDPQLDAQIAAARQWFGTIDVVGLRDVRVPGLFKPVELRTQDPRGALGRPMLDVREGRFPATDDEIALTRDLATSLQVAIGQRFTFAGVQRQLVGIVENPGDLGADFALAAPSANIRPESLTVLVKASDARVMAFRAPGWTNRVISARGTGAGGVLAAVGVFGVATLAMVLVALVAAASFVVMAQRRLRQLGMLTAVGATEGHLRLVMIASGAVVGVVAAVVGAAAGFAGWIAAAPYLEEPLGYRIDRFNVPWWLIAVGMALAVVAATAAAWWPARSVSRIPVTLALSGRPAPPRPVHRSATMAGLFIVVGISCLAASGDVAGDTVNWGNVLLIVGGTVATVVGILLAGPLALRALAALADRLPVAPRLAVRDLARYQARSGAALAAMSLALGIPVATVVASTAAHNTPDKGNLSDNQLLVRASNDDGPFAPRPADLQRMRRQVDRLAAAIGNPVVSEFAVALDPKVPPPPDLPGRLAITLAVRSADGWRDLSLLYVATPSLLERYGVDLDAVDPRTQVLTTESGDLRFIGLSSQQKRGRTDPEAVTGLQKLTETYSSLPGSFITPDALHKRGWESAPAGRWLLETKRPLTGEQLATARDIAADAGLTIETRDHQESEATLRAVATALAVLLALGILAMTVGLIRGEAAGDLRTLTATGATGRTRRTLTAATAGSLAFLGVMLGMVGAYAILVAGFISDFGTLTPVPVLQLAVIAVGVPAAAIGAGWIMAGREPPALARRVME